MELIIVAGGALLLCGAVLVGDIIDDIRDAKKNQSPKSTSELPHPKMEFSGVDQETWDGDMIEIDRGLDEISRIYHQFIWMD